MKPSTLNHQPSTITVQDADGTTHDATWIAAPLDMEQVALVDTKLAQGLRALADMIGDRDWDVATRIAYDLARRLQICAAAESHNAAVISTSSTIPYPLPPDPALN